MGCLTEGINEVIATTRDNAAPMGVIRKNDHYSMVIYQTSATAANIEKYSWVVANIVFDPLLFVQTAFSDISPDMLQDVEIEGIGMQHLKAADCWIAYAAEVVNRTEEKILVFLQPLHCHLTPSLPRAVNRGFYSVIEATVHATRYIITRDPVLASHIRHHGIIVKKCGSNREKEAFALLCEIIREKKER